jgi:hypothetical protein
MQMRIRIRDPGIFLTLNPGSGINRIRNSAGIVVKKSSAIVISLKEDPNSKKFNSTSKTMADMISQKLVHYFELQQKSANNCKNYYRGFDNQKLEKFAVEKI